MTHHSENRQSMGYRDLRTAEMDPEGPTPVQAKCLGRYQIVSELGWGAMGVVYEAHDPRIDRVVAIKIINVAAAGPKETKEYRARFIREAQAAGRLSHPGIVTIYDVDEDPVSHTPYIVMEYVPGKRLDTHVAGLASQRLSLEMSLALAQQLAEALDYAHSQGIVHRDIKPGNVIVTEQGRAKIADFGIAKINLSDFTSPGQVLGTPAFMAPEQLLEGSVDGRSDLFSLGVILYWMLTGAKPFSGESATSIAFKLAYKDPIPATQISPDLHRHFDAVLRRALAKAPADRYQTGKEFALDLKLLSERKTPLVLDVASARVKSRLSALIALRSLFFALRSMTLLAFSEIRMRLQPLPAMRWRERVLQPSLTMRWKERLLQPLLAIKWKERLRAWDLRWRVAVGAALLLITAVGLHFAIGRRAAASAPSLTSSTSAIGPVANPIPAPLPAPPLPPPVDADREPEPNRTTGQLLESKHGDSKHGGSKHGSATLVTVKKAVATAPKARPIFAAEIVGKAEQPEPIPSVIADAIPEPTPKTQSVRGTLFAVGEHPFRSAMLSISVDGELAYEEQLTGARKLPFGSPRGTISDAIRLAPGRHLVEVHVVSGRDHYDQTQTIEGQVQANEVRKLEIKFVARVLQLSWK